MGKPKQKKVIKSKAFNQLFKAIKL